MSNKVQLIKQEIERIEQILDDFNKTHNNTIDNGIVSAKKNICKHIKSFIDSLPEEPASKDLDFLAISLEETIGTSPHSREVIKEHLQKAAKWGRNHFEDKSEMVSEDLDIAATSIIKRLGGMEKDDCVSEHELKIFKAAIDWQKQKDQETIELAEDHAMLAGMNRMKEEMMKDAVDAIVHQGLYSKYVKERDDEALANALKNYNSGDKVKILILKTE